MSGSSGPVNGAALLLGVLDVPDNLRGDALSRGQNGDARRVAHDKLAAHVAGGLRKRQAVLFRVEGVLGGEHHLGLDVLLAHEAGGVGAAKAPAHLRQGADQALHLPGPVPDGQVGQKIAQVPKLDLDVVLVPQQVVDLDARQAHVQGVYRELGPVEVKDAVPVNKLLGKGVVPADAVDLPPGVVRQAHHLGKGLFAPQGQVPPGDVQAGEQKVGTPRWSGSG